MPYCYFNGQIVSDEKAFIPANQLGATRGFGVFDFFRMRHDRPTFMDYHLDRFDRSQKFLDLSRLISREEILQAIEDLSKKNRFSDAGFKLVLFGDGKDNDPELMPFFYITQTDMSTHDPGLVCNLIMHEYLREYPEVKTVNYLTTNLLHKRRVKAGAIDVLFHKGGILSEAARSSIFIIKDGQLKTPVRNILGGITRKHILSFGPDILPVQQTDVTVDDLLAADEVFIGATGKEVMGVLSIEGQPVGDGQLGTFTQKIQAAYRSLF